MAGQRVDLSFSSQVTLATRNGVAEEELDAARRVFRGLLQKGKDGAFPGLSDVNDKDIETLRKAAITVLKKEPNLITIDGSSSYIVGDIHGNFNVCCCFLLRLECYH